MQGYNRLLIVLAALAITAVAQPAQAQSIGGFKGGLVTGGDGELELRSGSQRANADYDDESGFGLNGFVLFPTSSKFRVGASLWYFPSWLGETSNLSSSGSGGGASSASNSNENVTVVNDDGENLSAPTTTTGDTPVQPRGPPGTTMGALQQSAFLAPQGNSSSSDEGQGFDANLLVEYPLQFGSMDFFVYGEGGLSTIIPAESDPGEPEIDPLIGYNVGGGFGLQIPIDTFLLRADARFASYTLSGEATSDNTTVEYTVSGTRFMLNAGAAFDL